MSTVILSPHLDDAVLSCWHVLTQPGEVMVINVFAGVPAGLGRRRRGGMSTRARPTLASGSESGSRRIAALSRSPDGSRPTWASWTSSTASALNRLSSSIEQIVPRLPPDAAIYAPAALTNHTDHLLVRAAALELRSAGADVSLYADLPHATVHGWPAWVVGTRAPATKDLAAAVWARVLATTGLAPAELTPNVHALDPEAHARKLAAVQMYRTQVTALEEFADRPLTDRDLLGYEVAWATGPVSLAVDRAMPHR